MPRKLDPFWEYDEPKAPNDRQNLGCKLCGNEIYEGVYRLKFHLAQIPGHDVRPCINTNAETIQRAMTALEELEHTREAKKKTQKATKKVS